MIKDEARNYEIILNMDETPMYFDMPNNKTYDFRGVKTVRAKSTGYAKLTLFWCVVCWDIQG